MVYSTLGDHSWGSRLVYSHFALCFSAFFAQNCGLLCHGLYPLLVCKISQHDEKSFHQAVGFASTYMHPCTIRYPRGAFFESELPESIPFEVGKSQLMVSHVSDVLLIGYGNGVGRAYATMQLLDFKVSLLDLRFVKPLDEEMLLSLTCKHKKWFVFSDSAKMGGVGSAILEFLSAQKIQDVELVSFEYEDSFIKHGNTVLVEESLALRPQQLAEKIRNIVKS